MALAATIQNSFNGGEVTPLFYGRVDYKKYMSSLYTLLNIVPQIQGGATKRTGTKYIINTKSNQQARLKKFVFSSGDAFMIEFGDFYVRFYTGRAPVNVSGVAAYNGATAYAKDTFVSYSGSNYISLQNGNTGHQPDISPTWWAKQDAYQISSPYAIADVPYLRFQQDADVLYITHPSYPVKKLNRFGLTNWSFSDPAFSDGPYLQINSTATTLTPAATTGSGIDLTASSVTGINNGQGFLATDVGRFVRLKHSATWGWAKISAFVSTTLVKVDIQSAFGGTTATAIWRLGEWSATTGYPSVIFKFEDRLGFAASPITPTTINMSKTSDYENFAPTDASSIVAADSSLQLRLGGQQDPIRWITDMEQGLLIGTKGAEYVARSSVTGEAMSAINPPSLRRSTQYGSAAVEPVQAAKAILMVQQAKRKIREISYNYQIDGFDAPDITILADHLTKGNIAQIVYQQEPFSIVWMRTEDGKLRGMTYVPQEDVVGWHQHKLGGFSDVGQASDPVIESIETMPSPDGSQDDLWMIVKRYINGQTVRYVEYLDPFNANYDSVKDCYFVDCGVTQTYGSPTTTVTGLSHLEGQTVDVLADGSPQPQKTVSSGQITLSTAASKVHVGLPYRPRLKTLRPEAGAANGTAQGKTKRTHRLFGLFHQSVGCYVGRDFTENGALMDVQDFREGDHLMNHPVPLFSGIRQLDYEDDYNRDGWIALEQRQPLPLTILALMQHINTQDAA